MIINKISCVMRLAQCNTVKQGADEQLGGSGKSRKWRDYSVGAGFPFGMIKMFWN